MRRQFRPNHSRPEDFDVFWDSTRLQLEALDLDVERRPGPESRVTDVTSEILTFTSLGRARVSAFLLHWNDLQPRPLVIYSHGYGSQCEPRWDWVERGVNVLGVDIRGCGLSREALPDPSRWGFVLTGIESPETSVLRLAVCDYMQAVRTARQLLGERVSCSVFHGVSFAGGLALMSAAVLGAPDLLAIGVPTFGWAEGRNLFVKTGSGAEISRYLARRPDHLEDTMLVLRYFDTINFADRVTCPVMLALGLADDVVPAKTVYAIANHLAGPFEIMEFAATHTDGPEEAQWARFDARWLDLGLHGIPSGFGGTIHQRD